LNWNNLFSDSGDESTRAGKTSPDPASKVPQASASQGFDVEESNEPRPNQFLDNRPTQDDMYDADHQKSSGEQATTMWQGLLSFFKPQGGSRQRTASPKQQKIYRRGQTMKHENQPVSHSNGSDESRPPGLVRGPSLYSSKSSNGDLMAPPKTTVFESAGDLLNPPLPPKEYFLDPAVRPRTIFHDRVYHPDDIPVPPTKRTRSFLRRQPSKESASSSHTQQSQQSPQRRPSTGQSAETGSEFGNMKIEEKIARAYHKDLSWRKVLVRLEPDAHNNLIVRRMFANAYGWPVVKHLCDTHFAYTAAALTPDDEEAAKDRAPVIDAGDIAEGDEVKGQVEPPSAEKMEQIESESRPTRRASFHGEELDELKSPGNLHEHYRPKEKLRPKIENKIKNRDARTPSEVRESRDELGNLVSRVSAVGITSNPTTGEGSYSGLNSSKRALSKLTREDSGRWSDKYFEVSDDYSDSDEDPEYIRELEAALKRGEAITGEQARVLERWSSSSKGTKARMGSKRSAKSDKSDGSRSGTGKAVLKDGGLVEEPGEMSSREDEDEQDDEHENEKVNPNKKSWQEGVPPVAVDDQILSLTGVGLGKPVEEQIGLDAGVGDSGGVGNAVGKRRTSLAEQIAAAVGQAKSQERD
jgi:hypothetical protein